MPRPTSIGAWKAPPSACADENTLDTYAFLGICEGIHSRGLRLTFECETRLDRLDPVQEVHEHVGGLEVELDGAGARAAAGRARKSARSTAE